MGEGIHNKKTAYYNGKADTEAGHTREQRAAVLDWEFKHKDNKSESLAIINKDGKVVYQKRGGKGSVRTGLEARMVSEDTVITHNHPAGNSSKGSIAANIGSPLSPEDVSAAVGYKASEIRARTGNFIYSIKRPSTGWDKAQRYLDYSQKQIADETLRHMGAVPGTKRNYRFRDGLGRYWNIDPNNPRSQGFGTQEWTDRLNRTQYAIAHQYLKAGEKKYGYTYTRRRAN